jgi:hypothetical protein
MGRPLHATPVADARTTRRAVRDYITQNPGAIRRLRTFLNREFQGGEFTPRLQEAAELREAVSMGSNPDVAGAVRHLQQLITTDPRNAAEYLRQQAQLLEGTAQGNTHSHTRKTRPNSRRMLRSFCITGFRRAGAAGSAAAWRRASRSRRLMAKRDQVVNEFTAALEQQFGVQTDCGTSGRRRGRLSEADAAAG